MLARQVVHLVQVSATTDCESGVTRQVVFTLAAVESLGRALRPVHLF